MTIETLPFDAAAYLTDRDAQSELLNDAFSTGDLRYITAALETVLKARRSTTDAPGAALRVIEADPKLSDILELLSELDATLEVRAS